MTSRYLPSETDNREKQTLLCGGREEQAIAWTTLRLRRNIIFHARAGPLCHLHVSANTIGRALCSAVEVQDGQRRGLATESLWRRASPRSMFRQCNTCAVGLRVKNANGTANGWQTERGIRDATTQVAHRRRLSLRQRGKMPPNRMARTMGLPD